VRRAIVSVVSCLEAYDGARDAAARADSAAARAGQHIMAAAIVPTHQIGLDGPLTEHHGHWILNVSRRDIAMRVDLPQGLDQSFFLGVGHYRLNMIPNGDLGKGFGLRASLELDKHPEGQRATPCVACSIWDRGRTGCGHRQAKCQYRPETPSKAAATPAVSDVGRSGSFSVIERDGQKHLPYA
jgi:hypothetical protein